MDGGFFGWMNEEVGCRLILICGLFWKLGAEFWMKSGCRVLDGFLGLVDCLMGCFVGFGGFIGEGYVDEGLYDC